MTNRHRPALLDVDQANISHTAAGVQFDDPSSPWLVGMQVDSATPGPTRISRLTLELRHPGALPITAARVSRLPLAQMLHVAAAQLHPNELYYRMLAAPRQAGARSWDDGHWDRVREVCQWASSTGRPGGPTQAIADLWGVAISPTAYRWIARARLREQHTGVG